MKFVNNVKKNGQIINGKI